MAKDAATVAAKWATRLSGATQEIINGVNAVTEAPGIAAARQVEAWAQRTIAAKSKWAKNTAAVPLQDWQAKMTGIGAQRVAQGAQANVGKVQNFQSQLLPYVENLQRTIKAMPNVTKEDRRMRMNANFDGMSNFSFKK